AENAAPLARGTGGSNLLSSSGESSTNCSGGGGLRWSAPGVILGSGARPVGSHRASCHGTPPRPSGRMSKAQTTRVHVRSCQHTGKAVDIVALEGRGSLRNVPV